MITISKEKYLYISTCGRLVCGENFSHPQTIRSSLTGNSNNFRFVIFNILFVKRTQGSAGIIFQTQRNFCNAATSKKFYCTAPLGLLPHHFIPSLSSFRNVIKTIQQINLFYLLYLNGKFYRL